MIEVAYVDLVAVTSIKRACQLLGKSRATQYRRATPKPARPRAPRPAPANKLSAAERASVLATLNHEFATTVAVHMTMAAWHLYDERSHAPY